MEGELLVFNDNNKQIEQFRKTRKHILRAGRPSLKEISKPKFSFCSVPILGM
jgi:hypothetical protein